MQEPDQDIMCSIYILIVGFEGGERRSELQSLAAAHTAPSSQTLHWLRMWLSVSEPGGVYEVKVVAYNGNGESDSSKRLVSLAEEGVSDPATGEYDHKHTF